MTLHPRSPLRRGVPLATSPLTRGAQPLRKAVKPLRSRTAAAGRYEAQMASQLQVVAAISDGRCQATYLIDGITAHANPLCDGHGDHLHHRRLRSAGGTNDPENLLLVSWKCHQAIHDHPDQSYTHGFLLHAWQDPADIPINRGAAT